MTEQPQKMSWEVKWNEWLLEFPKDNGFYSCVSIPLVVECYNCGIPPARVIIIFPKKEFTPTTGAPSRRKFFQGEISNSSGVWSTIYIFFLLFFPSAGEDSELFILTVLQPYSVKTLREKITNEMSLLLGVSVRR